MSGRTALALFFTMLATSACNPVDPQVDRVDGAMYSQPGGGGTDAGTDSGSLDGGVKDAAKDAAKDH